MIEDAMRALRNGEFVLVTDDPGREDEADLTMGAELATPESIAFAIREARGLVCAPCDGAVLDRLAIGPMVPSAPMGHTAFSVSVDHRCVGSGISARDRAATIRALADEHAAPDDFLRPGHVFPLRARDGGVLRRAGHTEAAVDLCRLAGLRPCAAICEVLDGEGEPVRGRALRRFARTHILHVVSIGEIACYRRERASALLLARSGRPS